MRIGSSSLRSSSFCKPAKVNIVEALPMHATGRIDAFIPKPHTPTLFARYGNMLPVGFALLLLALAIAFRRRGR